MRYTLTLLAFVLAVLPATAQTDYKTLADSSALVDGGALADIDIQCMDRNPAGAFVFYNDATGDIATHDPVLGTAVLRSNAQIDADLNGDATNCFAITVDGAGNVYTALQDTSGVDRVYKVNTLGTTGSVLAVADGVTGLALSGTTLYLARVQFFGAPEDGFYRINTLEANQPPAVVLTDPGLDLIDLEIGSDGSLYSSSSRFGSTTAGLRNVVVKLSNPAGAPSLSVIYDPYTAGIFSGGVNDLEDLELSPGSPDRLYLYSNSFAASDGEQWGTVLVDGTGGQQFANETALVADPDTDLGEYTSTAGRQMVISGDELYVASRDAFGASDEIIQMTNFPPVRSFDLKVTGVPPVVTAGGSLTVDYVIYSNAANPAPGDLFYTISPGGIRARVISGTVPPGASFSNSYTQNVPGNAPPGTYTYTVSIGNFSSNVAVSSETFTVRVLPPAGRAAEGSTEWTVSGVTPWETEGRAAEAAARAEGVGAFPNPFARSTEIAFALDRASDVSLVVYDVRGREVATLADGTMEAGRHSVAFDASRLPSGVYVYRLVSGGQVQTGRVTLVK